MNSYRCRVGATVIASGYVLRTFVPRPHELLAAVRRPHAWVASVGPDAAAGTVCAALLWLIALWLSFGMLVTFLALAPGRLGSLAHSVASRVTPAILRRVVIATAGASIVATPATAFASSGTATTAPPSVSAPSAPSAPSASAPSAPSAPSVSAPAPTLPTDQPGSVAGTLPAIGWPVDPAPTPTTGRSAPPGKTSQRVIVRPGDSLWSIAAHRLGPASSDNQIRAEWPRWYAVNRDLIGADPNLLLAGAELRVPQRAISSEEK